MRFLTKFFLILTFSAVGATAHAQLGQAAGIGELMKPEYHHRDVRVIVEALDLDEGQAVIVESLFDQYRDEFDAGLTQLRSEFSAMREQLQPEDPVRVMRLVFEPFEDWREERHAIGERMLDNIKLLLNEQQVAQWDEFRRRLVREKTLIEGKFAGEHVNIFNVVRDMYLDEEVLAMIQPLLNEYDLALDAALKKRNREINDEENLMLRALQERDTNLSIKVIERQVQARVALRDLNDIYIDQIAEALPADIGAEFRRKALAIGYPRVYRISDTQRMIDAAIEMTGIEPELRDALIEMNTEYHEQLAAANQKMRDAIRDYEPRSEMNRAELYAARMENSNSVAKIPDTVLPELRKRDDVNMNFTRRLQQMLTDEQFRSLPGAERWIAKQKRATEEHNRRAQRSRSKPIPLQTNEKTGKTSGDITDIRGGGKKGGARKPGSPK